MIEINKKHKQPVAAGHATNHGEGAVAEGGLENFKKPQMRWKAKLKKITSKGTLGLYTDAQEEKGFVVFGITAPGIWQGCFEYPSIANASFSFKNTDHADWSEPPLDFGWTHCRASAEYTFATLVMLVSLYAEGAVVTDNETARIKRIYDVVSPDDIEHLVEHIEMELAKHQPPDRLS